MTIILHFEFICPFSTGKWLWNNPKDVFFNVKCGWNTSAFINAHSWMCNITLQQHQPRMLYKVVWQLRNLCWTWANLAGNPKETEQNLVRNKWFFISTNLLFHSLVCCLLLWKLTWKYFEHLKCVTYFLSNISNVINYVTFMNNYKPYVPNPDIINFN